MALFKYVPFTLIACEYAAAGGGALVVLTGSNDIFLKVVLKLLALRENINRGIVEMEIRIKV